MRKNVFNSLAELAEASHQLLKGPNIAVSGGNTYATLFKAWAELNKKSELQFYPVDERKVPFEDDACNWRVAYESLLKPWGLEEQKNHWAQSALQYQKVLRKSFESKIVFDQCFLGIGDDGHTASLFPGGPELADLDSEILETRSPKPPVERITLGLSAIWRSKDLILIVIGKGKGPMLRKLFEGDDSLPIVKALGGHSNPQVLLDSDASLSMERE